MVDVLRYSMQIKIMDGTTNKEVVNTICFFNEPVVAAATTHDAIRKWIDTEIDAKIKSLQMV
jgi:hypothetical protein